MIYLDHNFVNALDQIFEKEAPKSILLVTGGASYRNSPIKKYFENLTDRIKVIRYSGMGSNPQYEKVAEAIEELKNTKIDIIIGVGGGSVIDYAKLISLYLSNTQIFADNFTKIECARAQSPIVAIPTTSGTGSEATHFAVIYKGENKYSIATNEIRPKHAIIDPVLSHSMDPYLTACTGMDALCQAIESLWARGATSESKKYAIKALKLIVPNIEHAVNSPDVSSRRAMAIGAHYAGQAIDISKTTGPHALSYYLTHRYGIPHGEAVGMTMELFIELNYPYLDKHTISNYNQIFNVKSATEFIEIIMQIKQNLGLRSSIIDAGCKDENALAEFIDSINVERMLNNPVPIRIEMLKENLLLI